MTDTGTSAEAVERLNKARRMLQQEAMLAKPSEYDDDEKSMLDEFSLRVGLESCRDCVRKVLAILDLIEGDTDT